MVADTSIAVPEDFAAGTLQVLEEIGHGPVRSTHEILCRAAAPDESHRLGLVEGEYNVWTVRPADSDQVECPPTGKKIHILRRNGDELNIEFHKINDLAALTNKYPGALPLVDHLVNHHMVEWPLTVLEIWEKTGDGRLNLGSTGTDVTATSFTGNSMFNSSTGLSVTIPPPLSPAIRDAIKAAISKRNSR